MGSGIQGQRSLRVKAGGSSRRLFNIAHVRCWSLEPGTEEDGGEQDVREQTGGGCGPELAGGGGRLGRKLK